MKLLRATASNGRVFLPGTAAAPLAAPIKAAAVKSFGAYGAATVTRLSEDFPIQILSADAANRWSLRQLRARSRHLVRNGGIANAYLDTLEADIIGSRGIGVHMKVQDDATDRVITPAEQSFYKALNDGVAEYRQVKPRRRRLIRDQASHDALKAAIVKTARQLEPDELAMPGGATDRYACYLIERELKEFSKKGNCDVTGKHSLMDLCRLTLRTSAGDGDAVLLVYLGYDNKWGVGFQLIEGDYVDDYYNVARLPNGNRVIGGVEVDAFRRKVALWVFANHPGDYQTDGVTQQGEHRRIAILGEPPDPYYTNGRPESVQAIHVARSKRAEETRPVPWITPAMELIHHIEKYKEAEITAAREEACKHVFYERDLFASDGEPLAWPTDDKGDLKDKGELSDGVEPGGATLLPPGHRVNYIDPKHPNQHFPDFLKSMKREVAMCLNYCYNILFGDLEGVNFSSIRAGLQNQREGSKMVQAWFGSDCFTPIFETFLRMSLLSGALPFSVTDFDRLNQVELKFRRWPWVDPKNDAETAQLLLTLKVTTRGRIISDMSCDDFEATADELDDEEAYLASKKNIQAADKLASELENPQPPPPLQLGSSSLSSSSSSSSGVKAFATAGELKYSPDQPRDDHGRWTDSSAASASAIANTLSAIEGGNQAHHLSAAGAHKLAAGAHAELAKQGGASAAYHEAAAAAHTAKEREHMHAMASAPLRDPKPPLGDVGTPVTTPSGPGLTPAPEKAPRTFRFRIPEAPGGTPDIIDHLHSEYGRIASPASLKRNGKVLGGEYDGARTLPGGVWQHAIFTTKGTGNRPDEAAQTLHEAGLLKDGHPDTLWEALDSAIETRRTNARQNLVHAKDQARDLRFDKEARDPATAKEPTQVSADELAVGDKVQVGKEELSVIHINPDDLTVTLKDHKRYGLQKLGAGEAIYGEVHHPAGTNAPDDSPF